MQAVKFTANVAKLSARAPEEGGTATLTLALKLNKPDRKAFAALCEKPEEALKALDTVLDANGKVEIPCGQEVCSMSVGTGGGKAYQVAGATFKKVVLDARGGECQMGVVFSEPKTAEGLSFYGRLLGAEVDLSATPQQKTIDDEAEEKAARKKAPEKAAAAAK
jgi:predicted xylose isomerase-like sugar epimerase